MDVDAGVDVALVDAENEYGADVAAGCAGGCAGAENPR